MKKPKKKSPKASDINFERRRKRILSQIEGQAALFFSAPEAHLTRDQFHPYRQNSDFLYLTGLEEKNAALLLLATKDGPRSVLFLEDRDPIKEKWEKGPMGIAKAKRNLQFDEVLALEELVEELPSLLRFSEVLHYSPGTHPTGDELVWSLLSSKVGLSTDRPSTLKDARLITSELRLVKDAEEITALRRAADISAEAFRQLSPELSSMNSELHAAKSLEAHFISLGADTTAFNTIVASGKNATVLHHSPTLQAISKRSMVLIDAGASFGGYCADMTRTLPASGRFSSAEAEAYDLVLEAFEASRKKAITGNTILDIHKASCGTICKGLKELGIIKGSIRTLMKKKAFMPYFMHGTSHWLGIDVHDVSPTTRGSERLDSKLRSLENGNAITIEPGLYFDPRDKSLPSEFKGIGIRIEDSVLLEKGKASLLTEKMPKNRKEIEQLLGNK